MIATRKTREEMVEAWQRYRQPAERRPAEPAPRALNLDAVLDLGNMVFFTFRGRAYGIPPLAWRTGERLLDAVLELEGLGSQISRDSIHAYYGCVRRLQDTLWRASRPVGPVRRLLRLLRLHRNPYRQATEAEVMQLAYFFLTRRMAAESAYLANPRLVPNGGTS